MNKALELVRHVTAARTVQHVRASDTIHRLETDLIRLDNQWRAAIEKKISECVFNAREARRICRRLKQVGTLEFSAGVERGRASAYVAMARRLKGLLR